jgi:uncharacterized protein YbjQ (UPF0145 family)
MRSKDIAKQNGFDKFAFDNWLTRSGVPIKSGLRGGIDVDESQDIDEIIRNFRQYDAEQKEALHRQQIEDQAAEEAKQQALSRMLITSGFNFDGYTITKYSGYISGDDAVEIPRGQGGFFGGDVTNVADSLMASLVHIRRNALVELKEAAYALGCNAVIGVDFDYLTMDPETVGSNGGTLYLPYVFGVTANGNAVCIERDS